MRIGDLIDAMTAAGAPMEAILIAVRAVEEEQQKEADRKSKRAAQKASERARKVNGHDVSRDCRATVATMSRDLPPSPDGSPTPLPLPQPSTPPSPPKGGSSPTGEAHFEAFRQAYPPRRGADPSEPAKRKFVAAVKSGADPLEIIAAAGRYADEQRALGQVGTEFVRQKVTWLNQRSWEDYGPGFKPPSQAPPRGSPRQPQASGIFDEFKRLATEPDDSF